MWYIYASFEIKNDMLKTDEQIENDHIAELARMREARKLRAMGISVKAAAQAVGLEVFDVAYACADIKPDVDIPDLPTVPPAPIDGGFYVSSFSSARFAQLREARYTLAEIARATGFSASTVAKHVRGIKRGQPVAPGDPVPVRRYRTPSHVISAIRKLLDRGDPPAKVAVTLGLAHSTVSKYSKVTP